MNIVIEGFIIKNSEGINKLDIYQTSELKSGKGEGNIIERPEAYGVSLERCVQIIIQHRIDKDLGDIKLEKYISEYKKIAKEVVEEIKNVLLPLVTKLK